MGSTVARGRAAQLTDTEDAMTLDWESMARALRLVREEATDFGFCTNSPLFAWRLFLARQQHWTLFALKTLNFQVALAKH